MGVLTTALVVPWYSDRQGRKWPTIISYGVFLFIHVAIGMSDSIFVLYGSLFIAGLTLPGRIVVGLNYLLEFNPIWRKDRVMFMKTMSHTMMIVTLTAMFQLVTRHYLYIWWAVLSVSSVATITILVFIPESPNWQHDKGDT